MHVDNSVPARSAQTSSMMLEYPERVSWHEAGHILAATRLGLGVVEATLNGFAPGVLTDKTRICDSDRAVFYFAGFMAEYRFDPANTDITNSDQDFECAVRFLGEDSSLLTRVEPLMQRAASIVKANWRFVELLAHELAKTGSLSRERILRLVG
jgi:hypothetical protein